MSNENKTDRSLCHHLSLSLLTIAYLRLRLLTAYPPEKQNTSVKKEDSRPLAHPLFKDRHYLSPQILVVKLVQNGLIHFVTQMSQEMSKIALFWLRLTQRDLSRFIGSTSGK